MTEENNSGEQVLEAAVPATENQQEAVADTQLKEDSVPLSALQAERSKRQEMEEQLQMMKDHLSLVQQNQKPTQKAPDEFNGLKDDDIMTVADFKRATQQFKDQLGGSLSELQVKSKYPDFEEVVREHLPEVLKANPHLRANLERTQDLEMAYYLAKNSNGYQKKNYSTQKNEAAERIIKNSQSEGSLSSVGQSSPINTAKKYKLMSDEEFRKEVANNMG